MSLLEQINLDYEKVENLMLQTAVRIEKDTAKYLADMDEVIKKQKASKLKSFVKRLLNEEKNEDIIHYLTQRLSEMLSEENQEKLLIKLINQIIQNEPMFLGDITKGILNSENPKNIRQVVIGIYKSKKLIINNLSTIVANSNKPLNVKEMILEIIKNNKRGDRYWKSEFVKNFIKGLLESMNPWLVKNVTETLIKSDHEWLIDEVAKVVIESNKTSFLKDIADVIVHSEKKRLIRNMADVIIKGKKVWLLEEVIRVLIGYKNASPLLEGICGSIYHPVSIERSEQAMESVGRIIADSNQRELLTRITRHMNQENQYSRITKSFAQGVVQSSHPEFAVDLTKIMIESNRDDAIGDISAGVVSSNHSELVTRLSQLLIDNEKPRYLEVLAQNTANYSINSAIDLKNITYQVLELKPDYLEAVVKGVIASRNYFAIEFIAKGVVGFRGNLEGRPGRKQIGWSLIDYRDILKEDEKIIKSELIEDITRLVVYSQNPMSIENIVKGILDSGESIYVMAVLNYLISMRLYVHVVKKIPEEYLDLMESQIIKMKNKGDVITYSIVYCFVVCNGDYGVFIDKLDGLMKEYPGFKGRLLDNEELQKNILLRIRREVSENFYNKLSLYIFKSIVPDLLED